MLRLGADPSRTSGNDRFEGFVVDLATEIAGIVGFNFTIVPTQGYGNIDKDTGEWNGMIRELLEERADLAMADLSISYDREQVVDFTMPFLDLGISVLYVNAPEKSVNLFAFLSPFSINVWLFMIFAGFVVSLSMFLIARVSPFETEELDTDEGNTPFGRLHHCLWFSVASWMQQGCDFLPRAVSSRTVASFWWFFTLIMISSYTANLAAFLTIERMDAPISSAADLAAQSKIGYGCVATGSTAAFFRDSSDPVYSKMWEVMWRDRKEVMMTSNQDGVDKVMASGGSYAFFMESTSIEYQVERECKLQQVGGLLDSKKYGIALPQGSPLRAAISSAIIKLNEERKIFELKEKWWKEERGGGACQEEEGGGSVSELGMKNVGGIFLVMLLGIALGGAVAGVEYCAGKCQRSKKTLTY